MIWRNLRCCLDTVRKQQFVIVWPPSSSSVHLNSFTSSKQCDQMVRLFFNIWPLATMKMCQILFQICQSRPIILQNMKKTVEKLPKTCKVLPNWQKVAKSGHTDCDYGDWTQDQIEAAKKGCCPLTMTDWEFRLVVVVVVRCTTFARTTITNVGPEIHGLRQFATGICKSPLALILMGLNGRRH